MAPVCCVNAILAHDTCMCGRIQCAIISLVLFTIWLFAWCLFRPDTPFESHSNYSWSAATASRPLVEHSRVGLHRLRSGGNQGAISLFELPTAQLQEAYACEHHIQLVSAMYSFWYATLINYFKIGGAGPPQTLTLEWRLPPRVCILYWFYKSPFLTSSSSGPLGTSMSTVSCIVSSNLLSSLPPIVVHSALGWSNNTLGYVMYKSGVSALHNWDHCWIIWVHA